MPATASTTGQSIADCLRVTLNYADMLVKDIPEDKFAHMPHENMSHPAFCIGHQAMYPNRVLTMIGRDDLVEQKPGYAELFEANATCVEQDGRYPQKDEIIAHYHERHQKLLDALPDVPESVFQQENPAEGRMRKMFPTIGGVTNFYVNNHNMLHLGQISAWRRAVGLGPVM